jgi:hypothetical protein
MTNDPRPRDHTDDAKDIARELADVAGTARSLKGEAMDRPEEAVTIGAGTPSDRRQQRRPVYMYIGDRKERERYMDNLERQMEDQREKIERTLDRMEGSGRRGGALQRLRGSLPRFPARGTGEAREEAPQSPESPGLTGTPTEDTGVRETATKGPWWRRKFGGG